MPTIMCPVLSMPDSPPADTAQIKQMPVKAIVPSGDEVEITEIVAMQPVIPQEATPTSLPQTGSTLPLVLACGLLALGGALSVRLAIAKL